jgi:hypothetical protein
VEAAAQAQGLSLNIVHEHDSARVIRSLYHCGAGFTFSPACSLADVPPWQLRQAGASGAPAGSAPADWIVAQVVAPVLPRQYTLAVQAKRTRDAATQAVLQALAAHAQALMDQGIWRAQSLLNPG